MAVGEPWRADGAKAKSAASRWPFSRLSWPSPGRAG